MNAPLTIKIDDQQARKAAMFDALQEFGSNHQDAVVDGARARAEADQAAAMRLERLSHRYATASDPHLKNLSESMKLSARHLRYLSGRALDVAAEVDRSDGLFLMPGDV